MTIAANTVTTQASDGSTGAGCQACHDDEVIVFFEADAVPVHNSLLLESEDAARAFPRGDLRLGHCPTCGFVQNMAFDADRLHYGPGYEDSQAHSPRFMDFATGLARSLIARHGLHERDIVEVGSGKDDFLRLLCELGANRGIGYDPATDPADVDTALERGAMHHRAELFGPDTGLDALDLLVCRHTLEHVADVSAFVAMLAAQLARHPGAVGYLEVPDVARVLREGAFWDLYYEHCSYFTRPTLTDLLARHDLGVLQARLGYDGQYVQVEVGSRSGDGPEPRPSPDAAREVADGVARFAARIDELRSRWQVAFAEWSDAGRRVLLWGGGSKAVGFLTTLGLADEVAAVVDINPRKHGRFLPGTGHQVIGPEALASSPPDVVIVLNPIYVAEIRRSLAERGLAPEVLTA